MTAERCAHCPVQAARYCHGRRVRRMCQLIDPAHPDFTPGYDRAVIATSADVAAVEAGHMPPVVTQVASLARSFWHWAVSGFKLSSQEEVSRRRGICATCPEWLPLAAQCRICGCFTEAKIRLKSEYCPLNPPKW